LMILAQKQQDMITHFNLQLNKDGVLVPKPEKKEKVTGKPWQVKSLPPKEKPAKRKPWEALAPSKTPEKERTDSAEKAE